MNAYNQAIDKRAARAASAFTPFRHIETIAEAGARNRAARAASGGLAVLASSVGTVVSAVASSLPSFNDAAEGEDAVNLGNVSELGTGSTPLGNAAPFEYVKSVTGDDVMSIAARGVSEGKEAQCFAEYEIDMDLCSAGGAMFKSPAYFLECKSRAFANYQQCRGY